MTAVLCTNLFKAVQSAKKNAPKPVKSLPVSSHVLIQTNNGRVYVTPFAWEKREELTESVNAMVDAEFAICLPLKPLLDWLRVTQEPKAKHGEDRIEIEVSPLIMTATIKAGNTRAHFKGIDPAEFPPVTL